MYNKHILVNNSWQMYIYSVYCVYLCTSNRKEKINCTWCNDFVRKYIILSLYGAKAFHFLIPVLHVRRNLGPRTVKMLLWVNCDKADEKFPAAQTSFFTKQIAATTIDVVIKSSKELLHTWECAGLYNNNNEIRTRIKFAVPDREIKKTIGLYDICLR